LPSTASVYDNEQLALDHHCHQTANSASSHQQHQHSVTTALTVTQSQESEVLSATARTAWTTAG